MKKVFLFLAVITTAAAFVACGNKKPDKTARVGGARSGNDTKAPAPIAPNQLGYNNWGVLTIPQAVNINDSGNQVQYNSHDVMRIFLNTDFPWGVLGSIDQTADPDYNSQWYPTNPGCAKGCGVGISMGIDNGNQHSPLQLATNVILNQIGSQKVQITGGGISLAFYDSLYGTPSYDDPSFTLPVAEVWVPVVNDGTSFIQGSSVNIVFVDSKGTVTVNGQIQNGYIKGTVSFVNQLDWQNLNTTPASGLLGNFQVNACSVFRCQ